MTPFTKDAVKGAGVLMLVVGGNFVGETLSCNLQRTLSENMYMKQILILLSIHYAISSSQAAEKLPSDTYKPTLLLFLLYLCFTKMHLKITLAIAALVAITTEMDRYKRYHEESGGAKRAVELEVLESRLVVVIGAMTAFGFYKYAAEKREQYRTDWKLSRFLLGTVKCGGKT
jgi:hypothetical protein